MKAVNQFYNKQRAKYKTLYKAQGLMGKWIKRQPSRLDWLDRIRNNKDIAGNYRLLPRAFKGHSKLTRKICVYGIIWGMTMER
ncbi:MAG TPA: hypothetical protein VMV49_05590 [Candidatus Deferrimicrobium sp.]|nr:hypothetical protein [Candidatus Deferrimicrobium sp.]